LLSKNIYWYFLLPFIPFFNDFYLSLFHLDFCYFFFYFSYLFFLFHLRRAIGVREALTQVDRAEPDGEGGHLGEDRRTELA